MIETMPLFLQGLMHGSAPHLLLVFLLFLILCMLVMFIMVLNRIEVVYNECWELRCSTQLLMNQVISLGNRLIEIEKRRGVVEMNQLPRLVRDYPMSEPAPILPRKVINAKNT